MFTGCANRGLFQAFWVFLFLFWLIFEQTQSTYLPKWFRIPLLMGKDCIKDMSTVPWHFYSGYFICICTFRWHVILWLLNTDSAFFKTKKNNCSLFFNLWMFILARVCFEYFCKYCATCFVLFDMKKFLSHFLPPGNICWEIKEKSMTVSSGGARDCWRLSQSFNHNLIQSIENSITCIEMYTNSHIYFLNLLIFFRKSCLMLEKVPAANTSSEESCSTIHCVVFAQS